MADRIEVPSAHVLDTFAPKYAHKLFLSPYGVDLEQFPLRTGPLSPEPTVLFVGNLSLRMRLLRRQKPGGGPFYLDTLGVCTETKRRIERDSRELQSAVDPVVSWIVATTSGRAYSSLTGNLSSHPIPEISFGPNQQGHRMLDVGCSWGRRSNSAARKGWRAFGIDPSLGASMAARRLAAAEQLTTCFVCGDARFVPFKDETFQAVFCYSVLQHFDEPDMQMALTEVSRVMARGGIAKIQMAHRGGLMSTYQRTRKSYLRDGCFRVRYWSLHSLQDVFERTIGPTCVSAEAFGGLGLLYSDYKILFGWARIAATLSEVIKRIASNHAVPQIYFRQRSH
jgi:2-polyprenyl-3-methyl-5-hydroxy-6-metoxy-1,4-benzoquinol methylase